MPTYLSPGVYVEEVASGARPIEGVGTGVAAFVGLAPTGPLDEPVLVRNWAQFVGIFGDFTEDYYLAHAVYGYFSNGGSTAYVVRVGENTGESRPEAPARPDHQRRELPESAYAAIGPFRVAAAEGVDTEGLSVEIRDANGEGAEDRFTFAVKQGDNTAESFEVTPRRNTRNYVVSAVRQRSKLVVVEEAAPVAQLARPENQQVAVPALPPRPTVAVAVPQGGRLQATSFLGDAAERTGMGSLEALDEISIVVAPDLMGAFERGAIDLDTVKSVQLGMIAHCERLGDRMAILDPPPAYTPGAIRRWRQDGAGYDSTHAALYYPWIQVFDPSTGQQRLVPPSGHLAGVWARSDAERGVHKAPANEVLRGAVDLELQISRGEQDLLNPIGVNCIRAFPGRGIRVWGARTVSSDPAWRYLNVRRYFNYLEESILLGTQWVVFEPNDELLWGRIRRNVSAFLVNEWRTGALFGATAEQAFYVKCDADNNTPESIDAGRVICEIGVAPVKPAEFVIFRLAQYSEGGAELSE